MDWVNWYSGDFVHVPDDVWPDRNLKYDELVARVAKGFRHVTFDWITGDLWVAERRRGMIELGAPAVVMRAEDKLVGNSVLVTVADTSGTEGCRVGFFLTRDTGVLELGYQPVSDIEGGRALGRKLAEVLGYTFTTREEDEAAFG